MAPPSSYKIKLLPKGQQFAVVRMDPVSMVAHLNLDRIAVEEAMAMRPKKYLVYLDSPQDLPLPKSEWCRYWVEPVATTLRPDVPEKGITSDMVLPIYPNYQYAKGRHPVQSTPQFPFSNCFFWIQSTMSLRVRVKRGEDAYDNDKATTVSTAQHTAMMNAWNEDALRMFSLRRARAPRPSAAGMPASGHLGAARPSPSVPLQHDARHSTSHATHAFPPTPPEYPDSDTSSDEDDFVSNSSTWGSDRGSSPVTSDNDSVGPNPELTLPPIPPLMEMAIDMNVFGWARDPKVPFIPLVDLWFELEEHLSPNDIPSPTELWQEQETIGTIIEAALRRRVAATRASREDPIPHSSKRHIPSPPRPSPDKSVRPQAHSTTAPSQRRPPLFGPEDPRTVHLSHMKNKLRPQLEAKHPQDDSDARPTGPRASFASLFQSLAPLGNQIASWGFRTPSTPSPPPNPVSPPASRPASSKAATTQSAIEELRKRPRRRKVAPPEVQIHVVRDRSSSHS